MDMRLVVATPLYPPEIGGPATDAAAIAAALAQKGNDVIVVPLSRTPHLPKGIRHLAYAYLLWKAARNARAIVAFDLVSIGVPAALVARFRGVPLIVRAPGDYAWEQGTQRFGVRDSIDAFQTKSYGIVVEFLRSAQRFAVKSAVLVIAPSDYFKDLMSGWGIAPERLIRIYLGINFSDQVQLPQSVPAGNVIFSLGRFVPWKGFSMLIRLLTSMPDWHLVIAGDGPLRGALEREARDLEVIERVTFTGALPRAEALGWYRSADAFVLNTSFESFSFQVLEAMESGTPIIATKIGSLPELVTDGVEGVLLTPDDASAFRAALESTQKEPHVWKNRTEAARRKAATFSIEASTDAFVKELERVCG